MSVNESSKARELRVFLPKVYDRYGPLNARQYAYRAEAAGIIDTSRGKKKPFDYVNRVLVKLRESGSLPWSAVLDSSRSFEPWLAVASEDIAATVKSEADRFRGLPDEFQLPPWQYQHVMPVIFTEKEGLIPYFEMIANKRAVSIYAQKGQAGKSHLHETIFPWLANLTSHFRKIVKLLYLGDCDDEGFQIPLTLLETIDKWAHGWPELDTHDLYPRRKHELICEGSILRFRRLALSPEQVESMKLSTLEINRKSTIAGKFVDFKCELEAMEPDILRNIIEASLMEDWDEESERKRRERTEELREEFKQGVEDLTGNWGTGGET